MVHIFQRPRSKVRGRGIRKEINGETGTRRNLSWFWYLVNNRLHKGAKQTNKSLDFVSSSIGKCTEMSFLEPKLLDHRSGDPCPSAGPTLCAVSANCWALFFMSSVFSSARPNRSPRSFKAWLAFCTALVTLSAAEWRMLFPEETQQEHQRLPWLNYSDSPARGEHL